MAGKKGTTFEMRFWSKVDRNGPVPEHMPHLGQCWVWVASKDTGGYGRIGRNRGVESAHRVSWILANGTPPADMPYVLHDCDNPACVNPAHLHVGTKRMNAEEREARRRGNPVSGDQHWTRARCDNLARGVRHGRHTHPESTPRGDRHWVRISPELATKGERIGTSKVTAADVLEIRRRRVAGETLASIAVDYNISETNVSRIAHRKIWAHVTDDHPAR